MRTGAKMLLMNEHSGSGNRYSNRDGRYVRNEYGMENNYRMNDNYGNMETGMDEMESRRRRDSRGRFRSEMEMNGGGHNMDYRHREERMEYPNRPFPVYRRDDQVNQIGFVAEDGIRTDYGMNATYHHGNEMENRSAHKMSGGAYSDVQPVTKELAEEWTGQMKNADGTKGAHWTFDQVKQVMAQKGIKGDPYEFFMVLNMIYSDYCAVLKKHRVNNLDVYVDLACAWLMDEDSVDDKATAYYECVVKHE